MNGEIAHHFSTLARRRPLDRAGLARAPAGAPTAIDPSPGWRGHACCVGASR